MVQQAKATSVKHDFRFPHTEAKKDLSSLIVLLLKFITEIFHEMSATSIYACEYNAQ
jgi:hypothetical protein